MVCGDGMWSDGVWSGGVWSDGMWSDGMWRRVCRVIVEGCVCGVSLLAA